MKGEASLVHPSEQPPSSLQSITVTPGKCPQLFSFTFLPYWQSSTPITTSSFNQELRRKDSNIMGGVEGGAVEGRRKDWLYFKVIRQFLSYSWVDSNSCSCLDSNSMFDPVLSVQPWWYYLISLCFRLLFCKMQRKIIPTWHDCS